MIHAVSSISGIRQEVGSKRSSEDRKRLAMQIRRTDSAAERREACHAWGCRRLHYRTTEAEHDVTEWQDAMQALLIVVDQNGHTMPVEWI